jgi:1-pyrroline-5-carboxylate dehydrogenase
MLLYNGECKRFKVEIKGGIEMIPYKHEPFTDFSQEANKKAFEEALALVTQELVRDYPLAIGGKHVTTEDEIVSVNPANKEEIVERVS